MRFSSSPSVWPSNSDLWPQLSQMMTAVEKDRPGRFLSPVLTPSLKPRLKDFDFDT